MSTLALAACTVSTTGTGGGGSTSSTTSTTAGTAGGGVGGAGGNGTGGENAGGAGGGGVGGGAGCHKCAEAVSDPTIDPATLCQDSGVLYDALAKCTCMDACATDCGDSVCAGKSASAACVTCLQDTVNGCGTAFNNCSNDL